MQRGHNMGSWVYFCNRDYNTFLKAIWEGIYGELKTI